MFKNVKMLKWVKCTAEKIGHLILSVKEVINHTTLYYLSFSVSGECDPYSNGSLHWNWYRGATDGNVFSTWLPNCQIHSGHRLHCRTYSEFVGIPLSNAKSHLRHGRRWFALQVIKKRIAHHAHHVWCDICKEYFVICFKWRFVLMLEYFF